MKPARPLNAKRHLMSNLTNMFTKTVPSSLNHIPQPNWRRFFPDSDPHSYAAITPASEPSLAETVERAHTLGASINATLSP